MKKVLWSIVAVLVLGAAAGVVLWQPWHHASMADSLTVIAPAAGARPPAGREDVLAIVYSGDGGWRDLDKQLGAKLSERGVPVLGVSALSYFWRTRSAADSAADLEVLIQQNLAVFHKKRVWLIGFSFGADVLPSIIAKLSPESRAAVAQLVLLSPTRDASFEIEMEGYMREGWFKTHTQEWMQKFNPVEHYDALPLLLALDGHPPVVCYYGTDEADDTICTEKSLPTWVRVMAKKGDHHFDGDYGKLAEEMLLGLPPG
ncbi:MAG TPA: AcvB/VirJ family lysyl-phosphatidylglycerol hydrolase [Dyella sp.]|uniref:AcvB/VirJ family lysyl-phosphatidylglycerol hydrolase n=1 Tax=Dyella sp. TaxID=1869338 RepID=UPI002F95E12A